MVTQLPPRKGSQQPPTFRPMSIVAKRSPISTTAELSFQIIECCMVVVFLQDCSHSFDIVGRASGKASGIYKIQWWCSRMVTVKSRVWYALMCNMQANFRPICKGIIEVHMYVHLHSVLSLSQYLSGARCKWFAYGPADAIATHHLLLH